MKFQTENEWQNFSFENAQIEDLKTEGNCVRITLKNAVVRADNSQNSRFQDMYCGDLILQLDNAKILKIVKEGYRYYDADGSLQEEVPNRDITAAEQGSVLERCAVGVVFTTVEQEAEKGFLYEIGIDVPGLEDEEEVDTFWLCINFERSLQMWERYLGPVKND